MLTISDFKKRVNKNIPEIYNYELIQEPYKFSIFMMFSSEIKATIEIKRPDGRFYNEKSWSVSSVEKGINTINNYLKEGKEQ